MAEDIFEDFDIENEPMYKYQEILPIGLEELTNKYEFKEFIFTNSKLKKLKESAVYECNGEFVFFF